MSVNPQIHTCEFHTKGDKPPGCQATVQKRASCRPLVLRKSKWLCVGWIIKHCVDKVYKVTLHPHSFILAVTRFSINTELWLTHSEPCSADVLAVIFHYLKDTKVKLDGFKIKLDFVFLPNNDILEMTYVYCSFFNKKPLFKNCTKQLTKWNCPFYLYCLLLMSVELWGM